MYALFRSLVVAFLKCPAGPPEIPAGSHESVQIFRAAPAFLTYRLLKMPGAFFVAILFAAFGAIPIVAPLIARTARAARGADAVGQILIGAAIVAALLLGLLWLYAVIRLDYEMRYYIVTDRSLRIREGVVVVRETTITFANIQNMRIEQGPLQRLFGIYDLVVETAGGGGGASAKPRAGGEVTSPMHQGNFRGIGRPAELRDQILAYQRQVRSVGLGDHDDAFGPSSAAPRGIATAGFGSAEVEALRAIRAETAAWRGALEARPVA
jgi:membrane protein YdbS with pleckstrin-like domain